MELQGSSQVSVEASVEVDTHLEPVYQKRRSQEEKEEARMG